MPARAETGFYPLAGTFAVVAAAATLAAMAWLVRAESRGPERSRADESQPYFVRPERPPAVALGTAALVLAGGAVLTGFPGLLASRREKADRRLAAAAGVLLVGAVAAWVGLARVGVRRAAAWETDDRPRELVIAPTVP